MNTITTSPPESPATVTQANKLIEASYHLTLAEKRVLLALLAQVHSHPDASAIDPYTPLTVTAGGIADMVGIPTKKAYELLADAVERLAERWVIINNPDPEDPDLERTRTRWVTAIDYRSGRGEIRTYFAPKIIPYITQLSSEFTRYRLQYVASMTSVYAIRLYELLIQWQGAGEREVEVDWLKDKFQIAGKYPRMYDFKKFVLQPAIDQINEHSNLWVRWGQRKVGRQVVALQFQFGLKQSKETNEAITETNQPPRKLTRTYIEKHARPGETWEQAAARLRATRTKPPPTK
jgi:plasmid replication initiation protein